MQSFTFQFTDQRNGSIFTLIISKVHKKCSVDFTRIEYV